MVEWRGKRLFVDSRPSGSVYGFFPPLPNGPVYFLPIIAVPPHGGISSLWKTRRRCFVCVDNAPKSPTLLTPVITSQAPNRGR